MTQGKKSNNEKGGGLAIRKTLEDMMPQLQMVLPRHITAERMVRIALTAIKSDSKLMECTTMSIVKSVLESAQLGLEPDGLLGHAYLIPYWNDKRKVYEAQLMIGYRGFIALAKRSDEIANIFAQVVYKGDDFDFVYGTEKFLRHRPAEDPENRGEKRAVYAMSFFKDPRIKADFEVLWPHQVEEIKKKSPGAREKDSPWIKHEDEMWRKTGVRRLAKYLPLTPESTRAVVMDEYREMGIRADLIDLDGQVAALTKQRKERLKGLLTAPTPEEPGEEKFSSALVWDKDMQLAHDALGPEVYARIVSEDWPAEKVMEEGTPPPEIRDEIKNKLAIAVGELMAEKEEGQGKLFDESAQE